jgi:hypothetical protein
VWCAVHVCKTNAITAPTHSTDVHRTISPPPPPNDYTDSSPKQGKTRQRRFQRRLYAAPSDTFPRPLLPALLPALNVAIGASIAAKVSAGVKHGLVNNVSA